MVLCRYRHNTTNAIESLNSTYRRLNSQRSVFPSDTALLKALYLSTFEATKKWSMPIRNWGKIYGELAIMYDGRLPDYCFKAENLAFKKLSKSAFGIFAGAFTPPDRKRSPSPLAHEGTINSVSL